MIIKTPMVCQNGHPNDLITYFYHGNVNRSFYLRAGCSCPKDGYDEGYTAVSDDIVVTNSDELNMIERIMHCRL